jgi:hypothetical protein
MTKYLYVKHWEYADPILLEFFQGLPKKQSVYRAELNPDTNQYSMIFKEGAFPLLIPTLITNNLAQDGYSCELVELSKSNILDLNLEEDDLDKIISWTENKTMINNNSLQVFQEAHLQMQHEQAERLAYVTEAISRLDSVNSIHVDIIFDAVEMLEEKNLLDHDPINDIALDERLGLGVNISRAQDSLKRYSSNDRRTNEDPTDLYEALYHIVRELERRTLNEIDE